MTAPVFIVDVPVLAAVTPGARVVLSGDEGRHAVTVRRLSVGEPIELVDGAGRRASGSVATIDGKSSLTVQVEAVTDDPAALPRVVVVQALPKGDRGELAVELLTEVGADEIVPWSAHNCVTRWRDDRAERALQKWRDAAVAAGKQARRATFPVVSELASTDQVVARLGRAECGVVLHESSDEGIAAVPVPVTGELVVVVGPEGGLHPQELEQFRSAAARVVRLGPSVLRTSSAGIAAVAALLSGTSRWAVGG